MSEISKVIASEIADFFAGFGGPGEPDIQSGEAQRLLTERVLSVLALRERAEPVAYIIQDKYQRESGEEGHLSHVHASQYISGDDICEHEISCTHLFKEAPTAPVVPEPVSQPYTLTFDQWLSRQTGKIDVDCGCVATEALFHWLRVAYEAGNSPAIPDGWIPVSERMPDDGVSVLAYCKCGDNFSGIYTMRAPVIRSKNSRKDDSVVHHERVTHWMPLPEAPGKN